MENITNTAQLRNAIALLEIEQSVDGELLRKQFQITYESLRPIKIIENTLKDIFTSPIIGKSILGTTLGIATGLLTKKIVVGSSVNIFRILFGSLLQQGVSNLIAQNPEGIKNLGSMLFEKIRGKKDSPAKEQIN